LKRYAATQQDIFIKKGRQRLGIAVAGFSIVEEWEIGIRRLVGSR